MPRVHKVNAARKDYPEEGISKGDTYYWWQFNFTKTRVKSKTYPKRSQLTKSHYLSSAYDIDDSIQAMEDPEDLSMYMDEIEALKDEAQDALDSMPEHLQETSSSGQTLQQYVDSLEGWHQELDSIDTGIEDGLDTEAYGDRVVEILEEIKDCGCPL